MDENLLRYRRELERAGMDRRAIAAGLLGVDLGQYLFVADVEDAPMRMPRESLLGPPIWPEPVWRKVTLDTAPIRRWQSPKRHGWASPIVSFGEWAEWTKRLAIRCFLWDASHDQMLFGHLVTEYDALVAVEDGWAEIETEDPEPVSSAGGGDLSFRSDADHCGRLPECRVYECVCACNGCAIAAMRVRAELRAASVDPAASQSPARNERRAAR